MSEYINHIKQTVDGVSTDINIQDYRIKDFPEGSEGKGLVITENNKVIPKPLDFLPLSGGKLSGPIDMSNFKITNLFPGTNDADAVTYKQLQNAIEGLGDIFILKGVLQTLDELPTQNVAIGNIYYVNEAMTAYVWLEGTFNETLLAGDIQTQIIPSEIATKLRLISIKAIDAETSELVDISYKVNDNNIIVTLNDTNKHDVIISGTAFWWSKFGSSVDLSPYIKYEEIEPIINQYVDSATKPVKDIVDNAILKPETAQENEILTYKDGNWVAEAAPDTGVVEISELNKSIEINNSDKSKPLIGIKLSTKEKNSLYIVEDENEQGLYSAGVQSDFNEKDSKDPSFIKNKPELLEGEISSENKNALVTDTQVKNYYNKAKIQIANTDQNFSDLNDVWINTSNNIGAEHASVSSVNGQTGAVIIKSSDIYDSDSKTISDKLKELDETDKNTIIEITDIKSELNNVNIKIDNSESNLNDQIEILDKAINDTNTYISNIESNVKDLDLNLDEKEDKGNKVDTVFGNESNNIKYPSVRAVTDLLNNTVYTEAEDKTLYVNFVPTEFYGLKALLKELEYGSKPSIDYEKGILTIGLPELRDGFSPTIEVTEINNGSSLKITDVNGTETVDIKNGDSAYQLAVNNGFEGTEQEWLESLVGKDGIEGHATVDLKYEDERLSIANTTLMPCIQVDDSFIPNISITELNNILDLHKTPTIVSPSYIFYYQGNYKWLSINITETAIEYHIIQIIDDQWNYSTYQIQL